MCVCFLLVSERIPKSHHSPETSNNNKAHTHTHTHTHVYYTITVARFLAIDDHHGGVFFQKRKQKNSRQRKTTTNIVSFLSLYLCGIKDDKQFIYLTVFFNSSLFRVHWLPLFVAKALPTVFPLFLVFLILRSAQINRAIHYITHVSCPLLLAKELFFMVGRNQWQELGAQHTKTTNKYNPGYYSPNLLLGLADCLFYIPYSTILVEK